MDATGQDETMAWRRWYSECVGGVEAKTEESSSTAHVSILQAARHLDGHFAVAGCWNRDCHMIPAHVSS
jgi:hypothetical protein